jgi:hypothetical protein
MAGLPWPALLQWNNSMVSEVEKLQVWTDDLTQHHAPLSQANIYSKILKFSDHLKE